MPLPRSRLLEAIAHLECGEWQAAHEIVQRDEDSPYACWAHGIAHLMEGDRSNAGYWYGRAKRALPSDASPKDEIAALVKALSRN